MAQRRKTAKRTRRGKTKTQKAQRSKYSRKKRKISRKRSLKSVGGAGKQDIILKMPIQPGPGPSIADARAMAPYLTYRSSPRDLSNLHEELLEHDYFKSLAEASLLKAQEAEKIAEQEKKAAEHYLSKAQESEQSLTPLQERIPLIPIDEEEDEATKKKRELKERRRAQRRAGAKNIRKDPVLARKPTTTAADTRDRTFLDDYNYGIKGIFEPNEVTRRTFGESWAALGRRRRNLDKYGYSDADDRGRM